MKTHQSKERKDEAPASTSSWGLILFRPHPVWEEWQEALSLPRLRGEHPLVAQTPPWDLLIYAKDLFVGATGDMPSTGSAIATTTTSQSSSSLGLRQFTLVCGLRLLP